MCRMECDIEYAIQAQIDGGEKMEAYKEEFIDFMVESDVLKF